MSLCLRNDLEQCLSTLDGPSPPFSTSSAASPMPPFKSFSQTVHSPSRSIRYSRNPTSSGSIGRLSFIPLPSSSAQRFDLHFLDFTFQSFAVNSRPSSRGGPPSQSRLPRLSQPLFEKKAMEDAPIFPPSFSHPNSPYVPLATPVRREYFRPLTPESYVSHFSGFSRSGAIAPEPWEHQEYRRYNVTVMKMSNNIRKIRRILRRKLLQVARHFSALNQPSRPVQNYSSEQTGSYAVHHSLPDAVISPSPIRVMSNASFDTSHTNSLAQWLNAQHQAFLNTHEEWEMSLEEYERIGSWINFSSGHGGFSCGIAGCQFHPQFPPNVLSPSDHDTTSDDRSSTSDYSVQSQAV
ncbi:hypothetical protein E1B28_001258 [Marasmius oreades]|uniref:Uncharacterized protein n=1 Tax=Marasmius oreades TaxID=181124 RepID=A0A9P8AFG6_9AGAR|nr:uncharacterized protein E1B28_001258 [Marasmius oreades]KAG7099405.1 hypothetical protein E1B28_001258 [Marasmius oreades]